MQPLTKLEARYYGPDHPMGPDSKPDATVFIKLDPFKNLREQHDRIHQLAFNAQEPNSFLFRLVVPAQTQTFSGFAASMFPTVSAIVKNCGNRALALIGATFGLLLDGVTFPVRLITLLPRYAGQNPMDSNPREGWVCNNGFDYDYHEGQGLDWYRGTIVIDKQDYDTATGEVNRRYTQSYFQGY